MDKQQASDQYWFNQFTQTEGRNPSCYAEVMQYAAVMQAQSKEHSNFWKGVFGL